MHYFYTICKHSKESWEIYFPDIENAFTCVRKASDITFMAEDVLNEVLRDEECLPVVSSLEQIQQIVKEKYNSYGTVIVSAAMVRDDVLKTLKEKDNILEDKMTCRINISIPGSVLQRIDEFRSRRRGTRSKLFRTAVEFYMNSKK